METKLTIELIPSTTWYDNVRSKVTKEEWDSIKRLVSKRANHVCEICGGKGWQHPTENHEIWEYIETKDKNIQKLKGLIALCPACHEVKHMGLAQKRGRLAQAIKHISKVNSWSEDDSITYAEAMFEIWATRSGKIWEVDISELEKIIEELKRT